MAIDNSLANSGMGAPASIQDFIMRILGGGSAGGSLGKGNTGAAATKIQESLPQMEKDMYGPAWGWGALGKAFDYSNLLNSVRGAGQMQQSAADQAAGGGPNYNNPVHYQPSGPTDTGSIPHNVTTNPGGGAQNPIGVPTDVPGSVNGPDAQFSNPNVSGGGPSSVKQMMDTSDFPSSNPQANNGGMNGATQGANHTGPWDRTMYSQELEANPQTKELYKAMALAEMGTVYTSGPNKGKPITDEDYIKFMETVPNRAWAQQRTLSAALGPDYYAPYKDGGLKNGFNTLRGDPALSHRLDVLSDYVMNGSDLSNQATQNASDDPRHNNMVASHAARKEQGVSYAANGELFGHKVGARGDPDERPRLAEMPKWNAAATNAAVAQGGAPMGPETGSIAEKAAPQEPQIYPQSANPEMAKEGAPGQVQFAQNTPQETGSNGQTYKYKGHDIPISNRPPIAPAQDRPNADYFKGISAMSPEMGAAAMEKQFDPEMQMHKVDVPGGTIYWNRRDNPQADPNQMTFVPSAKETEVTAGGTKIPYILQGRTPFEIGGYSPGGGPGGENASMESTVDRVSKMGGRAQANLQMPTEMAESMSKPIVAEALRGNEATSMRRILGVMKEIESSGQMDKVVTGPLAEHWLQAAEAIRGLTGWSPTENIGAMTGSEIFNAIGTALGGQAASDLNTRFSTQEFQKILQTKPNIGSSPEGRRMLEQYWEKGAKYQEALSKRAGEVMKDVHKNGNNLRLYDWADERAEVSKENPMDIDMGEVSGEHPAKPHSAINPNGPGGKLIWQGNKAVRVE